MKKFLTLIAAVFIAVGANADRQVLFESESEQGDYVNDWSSASAVCQNVPTVKAGDVVYVTFAGKTDANEWPQVNLMPADWTQLVNIGLHDISTFPYEASYIIVQSAADKINAGHELHFNGSACYISKVELEPTTSTEDYSKAIWIGNYAMGNSWNNGFAIGKAAFASAEVGSEVRVYYTDKNSGSFNPYFKADWTDFTAMDKADHRNYVSLALDQAILDLINEKGNLRICGSGFTVTHVDIISPDKYADAVDVTYDDNGFFTASTFDGYSLDSKIEFTYNTEGAEGYVNWGPMGISADIYGRVGENYDAGFAVKSEGENVVKCKLSDIVAVLNSCYDNQGNYGAYWRIWGWGNGACKNTRVSMKVYDCLSSEAEKFAAKDNVESEEISFLSGMMYATYVPKINLDFSDSKIVSKIAAYVVSAIGDSHVTLKQVSTVPAGTPIIVYSPAGSEVSVPLASNVEEIETNLLKADVKDYEATASDYALSYKNGDYGFYPAEGRTIAAGKAYISVESNSKAYTFNIADNTTAINSIETANSENAVSYNVAGQRVNANVKGIIIKNGRKFINK